jgi:Holliday junction resolvase RusA-like endonuclease
MDPSGVSFVCYTKPISQNQCYRRGRGSRLFMSSVGRDYKEAVSAAARNAMELAGLEATQQPCCAHFVFWYGSRANDVDGALKPSLDALQGIVYENDRQVVKVVIEKRYDRDDPRLSVDIFPAVPE